MSRLSVLCGKHFKEVDLGNGIIAKLKLPKVKHLPVLVSAIQKQGNKEEMTKESMESMIAIINEMLKKEFPDATEEELDEVILTNFTKLAKAFGDLMSEVLGGGNKNPQ